MASMTISTGKSKDAPSVEVTLRVPKTDADWLKFYGITTKERDAKALRTVRVDIANGGARDYMRELVKQGVQGAQLQSKVQTWVNNWKQGQKTVQVPILDLRQVPLGAEQIAALVDANKDHEILLTDEQKTALEAYRENLTDES